LVGARARSFYTETIHSVSPAVPRISDVDNSTTTATSAPSSWKYVAHPFFWIPTSITNACGLTTKDGQSTASSDLFQGAGRFSISSWYPSRPGYDCIHGCRIFSGISLICSIGVSLGKMDGASQCHDPLLCLDL